jgi:hypothetical protein
VSAFDATWLTLREPYDHAARHAGLADRFAAAVGAAPHLIDLACGTGSNLRYLAPRIPAAQRWLCLDHDRLLLKAARTAFQDWRNARGWASRTDSDDLILARPRGEIAIGFALVDLARGGLPDAKGSTGLTASALLDLTSAAWLEGLAAWCCRMPVLMALCFDGRLAFGPAAPEDAAIRERFLAHQRSDKGFGPALGPEAAPRLAELLHARGCEVALEPADWHLGRDDQALLHSTLEGIVDATHAVEDDPDLERWTILRRHQLAAGNLSLTVGHLDLLALPG